MKKKHEPPPKQGDVFLNFQGKPIKIMAFVDNWVMCRYKGCDPFTIHIKDFRQSFTRSI